MKTNHHNNTPIQELEVKEVCSWLGSAKFILLLDSPEGTWGDVLRCFEKLTGKSELTLTNDLNCKSPVYLMVACDEYISDAFTMLSQKRPDADFSVILLNDESGYGAIFSPFYGETQRNLLATFGDQEEAQFLVDEWNVGPFGVTVIPTISAPTISAPTISAPITVYPIIEEFGIPQVES